MLKIKAFNCEKQFDQNESSQVSLGAMTLWKEREEQKNKKIVEDRWQRAGKQVKA